MDNSKSIRHVVITLLLIYLAFLAGAVAYGLEAFLYKQVQPYVALAHSIREAYRIDEYNEKFRYQDLKPEAEGVTVNRLTESEAGYVLYTTTHDTVARLIDTDGKPVHEWKINYNDVWPDQEHLLALKELGDQYFFFRDFHVFPNGDIILNIHSMGITPWGAGIVKLDKDSNVLWRHSGYVNNDFDVAADGKIYAIVHHIREEPYDKMPDVQLPVLEDHILILNPDGSDVKEISIWKAFENSPFSDFFKQIEEGDDSGDPLHTNSIDIVRAGDPAGVPWIRPGYLLLSIRNINVIAVLDPESEMIVHAAKTYGVMHHDLDYLANGNFLLFDNRGSLTEGGYSRIVEFDPENMAIQWIYEGTPESPFESEFWGCQQRLENGRTLICHAQAGRIVEVDSSGEVYWEYNVPLSYTKESDGLVYVPVVTSMQKYDVGELEFIDE